MKEIWHWNASKLFSVVSEVENINNNYPFDKPFMKIIEIKKKGLGYSETIIKTEM
jgi:hypothetical protein